MSPPKRLSGAIHRKETVQAVLTWSCTPTVRIRGRWVSLGSFADEQCESATVKPVHCNTAVVECDYNQDVSLRAAKLASLDSGSRV